MNRQRGLLAAVVILLLIMVLAAPVFAQEAVGGSGYLAGYENTDPKPTAISWWSTLAYLISLLAVFAFVAVLAYFVTRFLSGKFVQHTAASGGRILAHLPLGPNRSLCVAELAERVFMLGVTEHQVTLLKEITDSEEIERLRRFDVAKTSGEDPFSEQFGSLQQLAKRIPSLFKDGMNQR